MVKVVVDGREFEAEEGISVYEFMKKNGIEFWRPVEIPEIKEIDNEDCPLINIVEVDGKILNPRVLKELRVREGMVINTRSKEIEEKLKERIDWLKRKGECYLIRLLQEFVAVEAESAGFRTMKERKEGKPVIVYDPEICIGCKNCISACPMGVETQEVKIFKQFYGCTTCKFSKPLGALREA